MKYKRLLLKISGEALQNRDQGLNHDPAILNSVANQFRKLLDSGAEIAVVVGGGNIFRGLDGVSLGRIEQLATIWNACDCNKCNGNSKRTENKGVQTQL